MAWHKKLLKNDRIEGAVSWLAAVFIRLTFYTIRWNRVGGEVAETMWDRNEPFVFCFWHGRLLMMPGVRPSAREVRVLISRHGDGRLIARTVARLGIDAISGSTGKGGSEALREMQQALENGICVGITPDGPRGPRMRASMGVAVLASRCGVPVVPLTYSVRHAKILGSWDRFILARPFTKGVIAIGNPITVPRDADGIVLEQSRLEIETALNDLSREADLQMGRDPIEPAPAATGGTGATP